MDRDGQADAGRAAAAALSEARRLAGQGRHAEARDRLLAAAARHPRHAAVQLALARDAGRRQDWRGALRHFAAARRLDPELAARPGHAAAAARAAGRAAGAEPPVAAGAGPAAEPCTNGRLPGTAAAARRLLAARDGGVPTRARARLARLLAARFPEDAPLAAAALKACRLALVTEPERAALADTARAAAARFPGARAVQVAAATAGLAAGAAGEARGLLERLLRREGAGPDSFRLAAWLAAAAGDHAESARRFARALAGARVPALGAPLPPLRPYGRPAPRLRDGVLLFAVMRDERAWLPWFLAHYRALGVDWFHVIDNGSADGTAALLAGEPDVSLYRVAGGYHASGSGRRWLNALIARHGRGNWCVTADADEELVLPGAGDLPALFAAMAARGETVLPALLLDLAPRRIADIRGFGPGDPPCAAAPFLDPDHLFAGAPEPPWIQVRGGLRMRLFGIAERLQKVAAFRGGTGIRHLDSHAVTGGRPSAARAVFLHHKILRDGLALAAAADPARDPRVAERGPRCIARYRRYGEVLSGLDGAPLTGPGSLRYGGPGQLLALGLMRPG